MHYLQLSPLRTIYSGNLGKTKNSKKIEQKSPWRISPIIKAPKNRYFLKKDEQLFSQVCP